MYMLLSRDSVSINCSHNLIDLNVNYSFDSDSMKHANNAVLIIEYTVTPIRANLSLGANTINTANINTYT